MRDTLIEIASLPSPLSQTLTERALARRIADEFPYEHDEPFMIEDWAHERSAALDARYLTRIASYEQELAENWWEAGSGGADAGASAETVPSRFLPDYAWPSYSVLLQGRGQFSCTWYSQADCERVRTYGWPHYLNASIAPYYGSEPLPRINGQLQKTYGQCTPSRPPLLGPCNPEATPAVVRCAAGGRTRLRVINAGFSMPLRLWIDGHTFTVVARDGQRLEANGPHAHLVAGIGQRYDLLVNCDASQTPARNFRIFAMVALAEHYPGAEAINFEAWSYAVLQYEDGAPLAAPTATPEQLFPSAYRPEPRPGPLYRTHYASWGIPSDQYLPTSLQNALRPHASTELATAPAAVERRYLAVSGNGNWWNNISASAALAGRREEWWTVNEGGEWSEADGHSLQISATPALVNAIAGAPFSGRATVVPLVYDPVAPRTYEIVLVNHEGQQHPFHTHGFTLQFVTTGWIHDTTRWRSTSAAAPPVEYDPTSLGLPAHDQPVPNVMSVGDTFTLAPRSYSVFRVTADNPGVWLMHCHMDQHLMAGQGFLWAVSHADGSYPYTRPTDDAMCAAARFGSATCHAPAADGPLLAAVIVLAALSGVLAVVVIVQCVMTARGKKPAGTTTATAATVSSGDVEIVSAS